MLFVAVANTLEAQDRRFGPEFVGTIELRQIDYFDTRISIQGNRLYCSDPAARLIDCYSLHAGEAQFVERVFSREEKRARKLSFSYLWASMFGRRSDKYLSYLQPEAVIEPEGGGFIVTDGNVLYQFDEKWNYLQTRFLPENRKANGVRLELGHSPVIVPSPVSGSDLIRLLPGYEVDSAEEGAQDASGKVYVDVIDAEVRKGRLGRLRREETIAIPDGDREEDPLLRLPYSFLLADTSSLLVSFGSTKTMIRYDLSTGEHSEFGQRGRHLPDSVRPFEVRRDFSRNVNQAHYYMSRHLYGDLAYTPGPGLIFRSYHAALQGLPIDTFSQEKPSIFLIRELRQSRLSFLQIYDAGTRTLLADIPVLPHLGIAGTAGGHLYLDGGFVPERGCHIVHVYRIGRDGPDARHSSGSGPKGID